METLSTILTKAKLEVLCARLGLKPNTPLEQRSIRTGPTHEYRIVGSDDMLKFDQNYDHAWLVRRYYASRF